jgi:hypothetical protein
MGEHEGRWPRFYAKERARDPEIAEGIVIAAASCTAIRTRDGHDQKAEGEDIMRDVHRIARWALLLAVALVLLLMASPALAGTFVYADSNEIYVLELDRQRGDLTTESPGWPQREAHTGLVIPFEGLALAA